MLADNYSSVSAIYPHLMKRINYKDWAKYILALIEYEEPKHNLFLELGGGNGQLAYHLTEKKKKVIVSDLSFFMLKNCSSQIPRVCCDMKQIPFKSYFDFIFSTFDSINYLKTKKELSLFLSTISENMTADSVLTFDVSLEANSVNNLKELNREGLFNDIYYKQVSNYNSKSRIHTNCFKIKFPNGVNVEEKHIQKIYKFETYFELIEKTGMFVSECFNTLTFNDASENSERVQFIVKKVPK